MRFSALPKGWADPHWWADFLHCYRLELEPHWRALDGRARECFAAAAAAADRLPPSERDPVDAWRPLDVEPRDGPALSIDCAPAAREACQARNSGRWARDRARALRRSPRDRLATCGERQLELSCECQVSGPAPPSGEMPRGRGSAAIPIGCDLRWLCPRCRARFWHRTSERAIRGCDWAREQVPKGWGWRLVTLDVRHSGDLKVDRERIVKGWAKLRRSLNKQFGRSFPYVLTWEVTPGRDGLGHVHAHLVTLWPFFPWEGGNGYDSLSARWARATDDEGKRCDVRVLKSHRPAAGAERLPAYKVAAIYACKYACKGVGLCYRDPDSEKSHYFEPRLAAKVLGAFYGKRLISASEGFWQKKLTTCCRDCGADWQIERLPHRLRAGSDLQNAADMSEFGRTYRLARSLGLSWSDGDPLPEQSFVGFAELERLMRSIPRPAATAKAEPPQLRLGLADYKTRRPRRRRTMEVHP